MIRPSVKTTDPGALVKAAMRTGGVHCFAVCWDYEQHHLPGRPTKTLAALCYVDDGDAQCAITEDTALLDRQIGRAGVGGLLIDAYKDIVMALDVPSLDLTRPLRLETVTIPKPWGREIWYTGIEARGVCCVEGTPLSWFISLAPELIAGRAPGDPVLLKILDPLTDAVYGDLYFELHEEKTEVYVVTHIDDRAWPDGTGGIRYGFDQRTLARYQTTDAFRTAYVEAVNAYRQVRQAIDERLDQFRADEGFSEDDIVPPQTLETWKARLEPELNERERHLRERMNAFTSLQSLAVGDVVQVPPFTPHALQHGVRVVEFQTPHYERHIISFAQKVLTQSHWDTGDAIAKANLSAEMRPELRVVSETAEHHRVDVIADFERFQVQRIALAPGAAYELPQPETYVIAAGISGIGRVGDVTLAPEEALYIPATAATPSILNENDAWHIALVALPRAA